MRIGGCLWNFEAERLCGHHDDDDTAERLMGNVIGQFITFALIFVTQSRTASFNSTKEKKRRLRSLPSTKRETMRSIGPLNTSIRSR
jgi:hypothetical protein